MKGFKKWFLFGFVFLALSFTFIGGNLGRVNTYSSAFDVSSTYSYRLKTIDYYSDPIYHKYLDGEPTYDFYYGATIYSYGYSIPTNTVHSDYYFSCTPIITVGQSNVLSFNDFIFKMKSSSQYEYWYSRNDQKRIDLRSGSNPVISPTDGSMAITLRSFYTSEPVQRYVLTYSDGSLSSWILYNGSTIVDSGVSLDSFSFNLSFIGVGDSFNYYFVVEDMSMRTLNAVDGVSSPMSATNALFFKINCSHRANDSFVENSSLIFPYLTGYTYDFSRSLLSNALNSYTYDARLYTAGNYNWYVSSDFYYFNNVDSYSTDDYFQFSINTGIGTYAILNDSDSTFFTYTKPVTTSDNYSEGYEAGSLSGWDTGFNVGYRDGKNDGLTTGYNNGYQTGYDRGVVDGAASANDYTFLGLIGAVIDAPVKAFVSLLSFEVFGVDLSTFLLSMFSIALLIFVIKLILGGVGGGKK